MRNIVSNCFACYPHSLTGILNDDFKSGDNKPTAVPSKIQSMFHLKYVDLSRLSIWCKYGDSLYSIARIID